MDILDSVVDIFLSFPLCTRAHSQEITPPESFLQALEILGEATRDIIRKRENDESAKSNEFSSFLYADVSPWKLVTLFCRVSYSKCGS